MTCDGLGRASGGDRIELTRSSRRSSATTPGATNPVAAARVPYAAAGTPRRLPGLRQWVLFHMPDHGGYFFDDPDAPRAASGHGRDHVADRSVAVARRSATT